MGAIIQAFDIFQTPVSFHYPLPLKGQYSKIFMWTEYLFLHIGKGFYFFLWIIEDKTCCGLWKGMFNGRFIYLRNIKHFLCVIHECNSVRHTLILSFRYDFQGPVSSGDLRDAQATRLNISFPINIIDFLLIFLLKCLGFLKYDLPNK